MARKKIVLEEEVPSLPWQKKPQRPTWTMQHPLI